MSVSDVHIHLSRSPELATGCRYWPQFSPAVAWPRTRDLKLTASWRWFIRAEIFCSSQLPAISFLVFSDQLCSDPDQLYGQTGPPRAECECRLTDNLSRSTLIETGNTRLTFREQKTCWPFNANLNFSLEKILSKRRVNVWRNHNYYEIVNIKWPAIDCACRLVMSGP